MGYGDYKECKTCEVPNGIYCEGCVEGRQIEVVSEYASTCDGCGELTMHESMTMDEKTQLGYCEQCEKEREVDGEAGTR